MADFLFSFLLFCVFCIEYISTLWLENNIFVFLNKEAKNKNKENLKCSFKKVTTILLFFFGIAAGTSWLDLQVLVQSSQSALRIAHAYLKSLLRIKPSSDRQGLYPSSFLPAVP